MVWILAFSLSVHFFLSFSCFVCWLLSFWLVEFIVWLWSWFMDLVVLASVCFLSLAGRHSAGRLLPSFLPSLAGCWLAAGWPCFWLADLLRQTSCCSFTAWQAGFLGFLTFFLHGCQQQAAQPAFISRAFWFCGFLSSPASPFKADSGLVRLKPLEAELTQLFGHFHLDLFPALSAFLPLRGRVPAEEEAGCCRKYSSPLLILKEKKGSWFVSSSSVSLRDSCWLAQQEGQRPGRAGWAGPGRAASREPGGRQAAAQAGREAGRAGGRADTWQGGAGPGQGRAGWAGQSWLGGWEGGW